MIFFSFMFLSVLISKLRKKEKKLICLPNYHSHQSISLMFEFNIHSFIYLDKIFVFFFAPPTTIIDIDRSISIVRFFLFVWYCKYTQTHTYITLLLLVIYRLIIIMKNICSSWHKNFKVDVSMCKCVASCTLFGTKKKLQSILIRMKLILILGNK